MDIVIAFHFLRHVIQNVNLVSHAHFQDVVPSRELSSGVERTE